MARPSKVTKQLLARAWEYANGGYEDLGRHIPTVEGLALFLDLTRETLYTRSEFSDILARVKAVQAELLVNHALDNTYNANFAKFLLSAKHDYVEKTAQEHTGDQTVTVTLTGKSDAELDAIITKAVTSR